MSHWALYRMAISLAHTDALREGLGELGMAFPQAANLRLHPCYLSVETLLR